MTVITKELALAIAKKLKANVIKRKKGNHDIAQIFHNDKLVTSFGIRRGSRKNLGHDHIPEQLFLRTRDTKLLGQCDLSREDWIKIVKEKNMI